MTAGRRSVPCPKCGAGAEVRVWTEYQGAKPHGGYVTFQEASMKACDCRWDDDVWDDVRHEVQRQHDPSHRNCTPEELHDYRHGY